jgi:hypothetical protein
MKILSTLVACLLVPLAGEMSMAQGSAGTGGNIEPRYLVDVPTAGMLAKGAFALDVDIYQEGGMLLGLSIGIIDRLSFGISYGGTRLIGARSPVMNKAPGVSIKVRLFEESVDNPAVAVGFDSQGRDGYLKDLDRYTIKSPGFFAAVSKNYSLIGFLSVHGGLNYSLERADHDRDLNIFAGVEKTIGSVVSFMVEYNLAINDDEQQTVGRGRGYLNSGLKWSVGGGLTLGVNLKDMGKNARNVTVGNRTVRLEYIRFL